ncbi:MAG: hypothetical protein LBL52_04185 [Rickettsiales bacterium]|jgi:hypothetical protein|nr:hypothetical protein [Rickettsiales bacterium]
MRKALAILLTLLLALPASAAKKGEKGAKRAASGGKSGAKSSAKGGGGGKKGGSSKGAASMGKGAPKPDASKKNKKSSSSSSVEAPDPAIACLQTGLPELATGPCEFLVPEDLQKSLKEPFLCVYNSSSSTNAESVYEYYTQQNYGVSESRVKADSSVVDLKYKNKGLYKYYEYLLDEIKKGDLKENKIFDEITETVTEHMDAPLDATKYIDAKNIESVQISLDIARGDITRCQEAADKIAEDCGANTSQEAHAKIDSSCLAYEAALAKRAGDKKVEALRHEKEIYDALLQRVGANNNAEEIILKAKQKALENKALKESIEKKAEAANDDSIAAAKAKAAETQAKLDAATKETERPEVPAATTDAQDGENPEGTAAQPATPAEDQPTEEPAQ